MSTESYAVQVVALIDMLRRDEGNEVIINCQDPEESDGNKAESVEVCADWTEWNARRFYGPTMLAALQAAYTASREKMI